METIIRQLKLFYLQLERDPLSLDSLDDFTEGNKDFSKNKIDECSKKTLCQTPSCIKNDTQKKKSSFLFG